VRSVAKTENESKPASTSFRKAITVKHAVAIYLSSVLGAGILVIPGLAARTAGAGSLLAWLLLAAASYPFAYTFSRLSARNPESGGIYSFAGEAFGPRVSTMTAWLFVAWVALGAPAVTLAAGTYLAFALPISGLGVFGVAGAITVGAFGINLRGIRFSGNVQVALVVSMVAVLSVAVAASIPAMRTSNFVPILPGGIASVGVAMALIVWSFLGYENVSNIAEEFENPRRDFGRSVTLSVVLIAALYLGIAFTVVGTGAYKAGGGVTPFAQMMDNAFGSFGGLAVSIFAIVVIFSTVNAYTAGMARVVYAAAKEGSLPRSLAVVDSRRGVPRRALLALFGIVMVSLATFYFLRIDLQSAFLATSGAAILTYVVGSAAGLKLLKERGVRKAIPWISLIVSIAILPFIGALLAVSLVIAALGFLVGERRFRQMRARNKGVMSEMRAGPEENYENSGGSEG